MNTLFSLSTALVNHSYRAIQWYSHSGHDQLVEILSVFGTVFLMFWDDLTQCCASSVIATYQWLIDTFNSCDTSYVICPPLSTDPGFITYSVLATDLWCDWQRLSTPVKEGVSRMTSALGIASAVVKELM